MVRKQDFDTTVLLPRGLDISAIRRAIEYIEKEASALVEIYIQQANVFSAIIGILGTRALDEVSNFEKHRNIDTAQQRFPDLKRRGSGAHLKPADCLESKGSKRPWAIQSHYDHAGWYVIWRYLVNPTETFETGKPVIIWRVDVVFLEKDDWKYEPSRASSSGGGRTHTFGVKDAAKKLRGKAVYSRHNVMLKNSKTVPRNGDD